MHSDATVCVREKEAAQQLREGTAQVLSTKYFHVYGLEESGRDRICWLTPVRKT